MSDQLYVPVRDEHERLDARAVSDLPLYVDDEEDRQVTSALLKVGQLARVPTVGMLAKVVESCDPRERKTFLERLRRIAGVDEVRAEREREAAERAARIKMANRPSTLTLTAAGWKDLTEEAAEALRVEQELNSRRARREADMAQRAIEAQHTTEYQQARDEQRRRELPQHLR
jgi:hypothetical protein